MKKFGRDQWLGIVLLIAAILSFIRLPSFLSGLSELGPIVVLIIGIYLLVR